MRPKQMKAPRQTAKPLSAAKSRAHVIILSMSEESLLVTHETQKSSTYTTIS
jgi:hypothetical protein